jgi:hypothetical protein
VRLPRFAPNDYAWVPVFGSKRIKLGPACRHLPTDELAAVIAHEDAHVKLKHQRQRWKWAVMLVFGRIDLEQLRGLCWAQELQADRWAAEAGCGPALIRFIRRRHPHEVGMWHPPASMRLAQLAQYETEAPDGTR